MKKYIVVSLSIILSLTALAQDASNFFSKSDDFFAKYVEEGKVNYTAIKASKDLNPLISTISSLDFHTLKGNEQKAYLINSYNLLVINQIITNWPITSPMNVSGFFDGVKQNIGKESWTLNELENDFMRANYKDARLHFVLVCGAKGCPPIINTAYKPELLETQLEKQTKIALNNPEFIKVSPESVQYSEIFKWYTADFKLTEKSVKDYINKYREDKIAPKAKESYYSYNWTLNGKNTRDASALANNTSSLQEPTFNLQTYNAGSLLAKGKFDVSLFNALYTQSKSEWMGTTYDGFRESFYSSLLQFTYGIDKKARINIGLDIKLSGSGKASTDDFSNIKRAFAFENNDSTRFGITQIGPRVKIQPFKNESNFTIQSSLLFPTTRLSENQEDNPSTAQIEKKLYFLEWDRIQWWNQFFYVKTFNKTQLFLEADIWYRIGYKANQASTVDIPVTAIFSYFPTSKSTVYALASHNTRNQYNPNAFNDPNTTAANYTSAGIGFKYQVTKKINLELLYTNFLRGTNSGLGNTFNIGLRYVH